MSGKDSDLQAIKQLIRESNGFITGHYLLDEAIKKLNGDEFIVSYETARADGNAKTGRFFLKCNTYLDFYTRIYLKTKNRFFHEIMTTERRKIYFDIDSNESKKEVINCLTKLISFIQDEFQALGENFSLEEDTILLTSSNESKQSYHLILPNHFCFRIVDLFHFAKKVVDRLDKGHRDMIDMGVYRRNQSMRMFGCIKRTDPTRILIPAHLIHLDEEIKTYPRHRYTDQKWNQVLDMLCFTKSLISFSDKEPKYIIEYPLLVDIQSQKGKVNTKDRWNLKVPEGLEFDKEIEYDDKYVLLYKNINGYHCISCKREHIQENPYVLLYKESKQAFFNCRRV